MSTKRLLSRVAKDLYDDLIKVYHDLPSDYAFLQQALGDLRNRIRADTGLPPLPIVITTRGRHGKKRANDQLVTDREPSSGGGMHGSLSVTSSGQKVAGATDYSCEKSAERLIDANKVQAVLKLSDDDFFDLHERAGVTPTSELTRSDVQRLRDAYERR